MAIPPNNPFPAPGFPHQPQVPAALPPPPQVPAVLPPGPPNPETLARLELAPIPLRQDIAVLIAGALQTMGEARAASEAAAAALAGRAPNVPPPQAEPMQVSVTTTTTSASEDPVPMNLNPAYRGKDEYFLFEKQFGEECFNSILLKGAVNPRLLLNLSSLKLTNVNWKFDKISGTDLPQILGLALFFCDQDIRSKINSGMINRLNYSSFYHSFIETKNSQGFDFKLFYYLICDRQITVATDYKDKTWEFASLMLTMLPTNDPNLLILPLSRIYWTSKNDQPAFLERLLELDPSVAESMSSRTSFVPERYARYVYARTKNGIESCTVDCDMPEIFVKFFKFSRIKIHHTSGFEIVFKCPSIEEDIEIEGAESSSSSLGKRSREETTSTSKSIRSDQIERTPNEKFLSLISDLKLKDAPTILDLTSLRGLDYRVFIEELKKFTSLKTIKVNALSSGLDCLKELKISEIQFVLPSDSQASPLAIESYRCIHNVLRLKFAIRFINFGEWSINNLKPFIQTTAPDFHYQIADTEQFNSLLQVIPNIEHIVIGKDFDELPFVPSLKSITFGQDVSDSTYANIVNLYGQANIKLVNADCYFKMFLKNFSQANTYNHFKLLDTQLSFSKQVPFKLEPEILQKLNAAIIQGPELCNIALLLLQDYLEKRTRIFKFEPIINSIKMNFKNPLVMPKIQALINNNSVESRFLISQSRLLFPIINLVHPTPYLDLEMVGNIINFLEQQENFDYSSTLIKLFKPVAASFISVPYNTLRKMSGMYFKLCSDYNLKHEASTIGNLLNIFINYEGEEICDEFRSVLLLSILNFNDQLGPDIRGKILGSSTRRELFLSLLKKHTNDFKRDFSGYQTFLFKMFRDLTSVVDISDSELIIMEPFFQLCLNKLQDFILIIKSKTLAKTLASIIEKEDNFSKQLFLFSTIDSLIELGGEDTQILNLMVKLEGSLPKTEIYKTFLEKPSVSKDVLVRINNNKNLYGLFNLYLNQILKIAIKNNELPEEIGVIYNCVMRSPDQLSFDTETSLDVVSTLIQRINADLATEYRNLRIGNLLQFIVNTKFSLSEENQIKFYEIKKTTVVKNCTFSTEPVEFLLRNSTYFEKWRERLNSFGGSELLNTLTFMNVIEVMINQYRETKTADLYNSIAVYSKSLLNRENNDVGFEQVLRLLPTLNTLEMPEELMLIISNRIFQYNQFLIEKDEDLHQLCLFISKTYKFIKNHPFFEEKFNKMLELGIHKDVVAYLVVNETEISPKLLDKAIFENLITKEECRSIIIAKLKAQPELIKDFLKIMSDEAVKILLKDEFFQSHILERAYRLNLNPLFFETPIAINAESSIELTEEQNKCDISSLVQIFESINVNDPSGPNYINPTRFDEKRPPKSLIVSNVKAFIEEVKNKNFAVGGPTDADKIPFFEKIEKQLKFIVSSIEKLNPKDRQYFLIELGSAAFRCGTAKMDAIINCYAVISSRPVEGNNDTPRDQLISQSYQYRTTVFNIIWQRLKTKMIYHPTMEVHCFYAMHKLAEETLKIKSSVPYTDNLVKLPGYIVNKFNNIVKIEQKPINIVRWALKNKIFKDELATGVLRTFYEKELSAQVAPMQIDQATSDEPTLEDKVNEKLLEAFDNTTGGLTEDGMTDLLEALGLFSKP